MKREHCISVSVILPAYNEENLVAGSIRDFKKHIPFARIVVVDNDSADATYERAKEVLDLERDILLSEKQRGKGFAVKAGMSRISSDIYILCDSDQTYSAVDAERLLNLMIKSRVDMVVGDRVTSGAYDSQNNRMGHGWGNRKLSQIISKLAGQKYSDVFSGLRVLSSPFVQRIDFQSIGFQIETELNVLAAYLRCNVVEEAIKYTPRPDGSDSKLSTIKDGSKILLFSLSKWLSFSPLHPFMLVALLMFVIGTAAAYRVLNGFINTGWPYTTSAVAAAAAFGVGTLAVFFGLTLNILVQNERRGQIANFLECKRIWNMRIDAKDI